MPLLCGPDGGRGGGGHRQTILYHGGFVHSPDGAFVFPEGGAPAHVGFGLRESPRTVVSLAFPGGCWFWPRVASNDGLRREDGDAAPFFAGHERLPRRGFTRIPAGVDWDLNHCVCWFFGVERFSFLLRYRAH
ncbi:hypothetical protein TcCL_Unassigned01169 [Trypanosoma cruzi]|nr:hypothetical protein TcCL_Unassigned01169 [Trypanosoma cruzi]